jgi:hypothetical protein
MPIDELLSADTSEQIVQRSQPVESADLLADAFGAQQVAHPSTRPDDAQSYATARKVVVQLVQHARAGEIEMRRSREVADDQPNIVRLLRLEPVRYGLQNGIGIDIEQRRFRPERDHVGQRFILGMAGKIGIAVRAGYATEKSHVRAGCARQQH